MRAAISRAQAWVFSKLVPLLGDHLPELPDLFGPRQRKPLRGCAEVVGRCHMQIYSRRRSYRLQRPCWLPSGRRRRRAFASALDHRLPKQPRRWRPQCRILLGPVAAGMLKITLIGSLLSLVPFFDWLGEPRAPSARVRKKNERLCHWLSHPCSLVRIGATTDQLTARKSSLPSSFRLSAAVWLERKRFRRS